MTTANLDVGRPVKTNRPGQQAIPEEFVREVLDGVRFYYPGFRQALKNKQTAEDIMADSLFQAILKNLIGDFLKKKLNRKNWMVLAGETGSHINIKNNLGLDVVVFEKAAALNQKNWLEYSNFPPFLVIEIDVNVELPDVQSDLFQEYVVPKINRLFAFGTQKVVWVFTKSKKVFIADGQSQRIEDWGNPIEILDGIFFNIEKHFVG